MQVFYHRRGAIMMRIGKSHFTRNIFQKDDKLAKVNYQYEKRQKELEKKKKKAEKEKRKEIKKANLPKEQPAPASENKT